MRGVCDYAVVYDITSNRERRRVDRELKNFGFRVQKSVFECRLNRKGKEDLIARLEKLAIKTGFIKMYRLEYSSKNAVIGEGGTQGIDEGNAYVV
jgi:CRISPR-associated protein Cas2